MIVIAGNSDIEITNKAVDVIKYEVEDIKNLIYTIRGKQVMLDSDVAMLYHYETKKINQTVKRNLKRFPENFCFQLTEEELDIMWSQFVTTSKLKENKFRSKKYLPYVFTEQGIAMLSGLLRNDIAIQVSINIIEAFVEMRKFIINNGQIFQEIHNIKNKLSDHDQKFNLVFNQLQKTQTPKFLQKIFFDGQIYDAYNLIINLIKKAKFKIIIIDNYIDDTILEMLSKKNPDVEVVILTSTNSNLTNLDISKFNKQYPLLNIKNSNKFHDRFIIIDNKFLYHCGASLKDLGKKCFAISKIEDIKYIKMLINLIND